MKRYYIVFEGIVQGVGFRWTLIQIARKYSLTGYCENLLNGNVIVEVQGIEEDINCFIKDILSPRRYIQINNYSLKEIEIKKDESSFDVKY